MGTASWDGHSPRRGEAPGDFAASGYPSACDGTRETAMELEGPVSACQVTIVVVFAGKRSMGWAGNHAGPKCYTASGHVST